jgi:hypothetical protein
MCLKQALLGWPVIARDEAAAHYAKRDKSCRHFEQR